MTVEVKFIHHREFVQAVGTGNFELEATIQKFAECLKACRDSNATKLLIDIRNLHGFDSATIRVLLGMGNGDAYKSHLNLGGNELSIAMVVDDELSGTYQPTTTMMQEHVGQVASFTDMEKALAWLNVKPDDEA